MKPRYERVDWTQLEKPHVRKMTRAEWSAVAVVVIVVLGRVLLIG